VAILRQANPSILNVKSVPWYGVKGGAVMGENLPSAHWRSPRQTLTVRLKVYV